MKGKKIWLWLAIAAVLVAVFAVVSYILAELPAAGPTGIPPATTTAASTTTTTTVTTAPTTTTTETTITITTTTITTTTTTTTTKKPTTTRAPKTELTVTSHKKTSVTTNEPFTVFAGTSDPLYPLLLDGVELERDAYGTFSVECDLVPGKNTFTFTHKGKTVTYTVTYNYVVMRSHSPDGNRRLESGASFSVVVNARVGSTVTATFRGQTITLKPSAAQEEDGTQSDMFVNYTGSFTLPSDNATDLDLGKVTFRATHSGVVSTAASGTIVCKKAVLPVIGEVVAVTAETFDGDKSDDDSRPTNNYLPKGTVDYVVGHSYFGDKEYLNLRCGRRVYVTKRNEPSSQILQVSKEYAGKLPDTNQLAVADLTVDRRATYLTLDTAWKAPFLLDLLPQEYTDPKNQDYTVDAVTCEYLQITFCYADALTGEIAFGENHPVFTHATVTKEDGNCVLRLYLRRVGGFYGWDASYNEKGQLCFYFLHPAQVTEADNAYGADLGGVTILLDIGHGGKSEGAYGADANHPEAERNYYLALLLQEELERMGATVVLNRGPNEGLNAEERCLALKALKPDLCIAIHHDSNTSSRPHGFGSFHSTLFSVDAARYIYDATMAADIYSTDPAGNRNRLEWHYYFVARMSDCPVVLTENGFMSNAVDFAGIMDEDTNRKKAQAIAAGTARYFLSIRLPQPQPPIDPVEPTTPPTIPDAILPTDEEQ